MIGDTFVIMVHSSSTRHLHGIFIHVNCIDFSLQNHPRLKKAIVMYDIFVCIAIYRVVVKQLMSACIIYNTYSGIWSVGICAGILVTRITGLYTEQQLILTERRKLQNIKLNAE